MLRVKSLFRAREIRAPGTCIYGTKDRALWLTRLPDRGARFRAETLYAELDVLRELRPRARNLMVVEARRDPAWEILQSIPFFGPVRVSFLLATMRRHGAFARSETCGRTRGSPSSLSRVQITSSLQVVRCVAAASH